MTQRKIIDLLDSIMPEILDSGNPESTMLKCAKTHNLAPAQLEKLGHVFNTMKTNVALEKMANRGNSFSIVDVPSMVSKYQTYDPAATLSAKDKSVHRKVNTLMKSASEAPKQGTLPSIIDMFTDKDPLMQHAGVNFELEDDEWKEQAGYTPSYDIMHKKASADRARSIKERDQFFASIEKAEEAYKQILFDAGQDTLKKYASIHDKFKADPSVWHEAVEDIWDAYGEKSAAVIMDLENYLASKNVKFSTANITKRANRRGLLEDRHNVLDTISDIMQLREIRKEAYAELAEVEKMASRGGLDPWPAQKSSDDIKDTDDTGTVLAKAIKAPVKGLNLGDAYKEGLKSPYGNYHIPIANVVTALPTMPEGAVEFVDELVGDDIKRDKKLIEDSKQKAKQHAALDELLLSDDVLSEADPDKVRKLYSTIQDLSPTFASDPNLVGPVLKEALQYDAIPVQQIKNIVDTEKVLMQIKALKEGKRSGAGD